LMNILVDNVKEIERLPNGKLVLKLESPQPHWANPMWTIRDLEADEVIVCCGFLYTLPQVFSGRVKPQTAPGGQFYALNPIWESVNVKNIYFVGGSMRILDKWAASGFIHGFRCNITALAQLIAEKHHNQPLKPLFEGVVNPMDHQTFFPLSQFTTHHCSQSAALFELFNFFCATITLEPEICSKTNTPTGNIKAIYWPPMPRAYAHERFGNDPKFIGHVEVVFMYGFDQYGDDLATYYFTHPADNFDQSKSAYIHPVLHSFRKDATGESQQIEVLHLQESLVARWDVDDFKNNHTNDLQFTNTVFNSVAGILNIYERKDMSPVLPSGLKKSYRPMTQKEIEDSYKVEPYLRKLTPAPMSHGSADMHSHGNGNGNGNGGNGNSVSTPFINTFSDVLMI